jgi:beta-lactamase regulating signal transducer with metallopeptidase domain
MHALGWALVHFLWQGAAIAALASILMGLCRHPSARYGVGLAALILMLAMPFGTLVLFDFSVRFALPISGVVFTFLPLPRDITPWVTECWLVGVALLSLRLLGGFVFLEKKRRGQSRPASGRVLALCQEVQQRLGLTRAVRYLECGWLQVPSVLGSIRPLVLLPVAALTGLNETQLRAVIAHELAHVRRWDFLVNLFQIFTETLLFYHPAIWWLNRRIRAEREMCCDEIAVSELGNRFEYADALVEYARAIALMEEWQNAPRPALAANHGILSERIFHILGLPRAKPRMGGLAGSLLLLAASLATASVVIGVPVSVVHENVPIVSSATAIAGKQALEPAPRREAPPATTLGPNAYPIPAPKRLVHLRTIRRPEIPSLSLPLPALAGSDDSPSSDYPTTLAESQAPPAPHAVSVVAQELAAQPASDNQYPAPTLKLNASKGYQDWTLGESIDYCRSFAVQTVTQGANRPMLVDDGLKQRLSFFYWHCMLSNLQTVNAFGGDFGNGPAYTGAGAASPDHAVNVSGSWAVSIHEQAGLSALMAMQGQARSCIFTQSGNMLSGSCTGREGSGPLTGVIDGKQIRWVWKRQDGRHEAEIDFIGMLGPDGAIAGQSVVVEDFGSYRLAAFTAMPGPGPVASWK